LLRHGLDLGRRLTLVPFKKFRYLDWMSVIYIALLLAATVVVSITGALFSISGLAQLFGGAPTEVAVMAAALELSKFIVVGFVYRYWGHIHRPLRAYLIFSIAVLMVITSVGIFGYLSNAYEIAAGDLRSQILEIEALQRDQVRVEGQIAEYRKFIDEIPDNRISRKFEFQQEYAPKIAALQTESSKLLKTIDEKNQAMLKLNTKVGPVIYLARVFGTDVDTAVKWMIILFVSVFDPLAVSLVFCLNLLVRLREKYRKNEFKIGAHSLTTPVDHRFRGGSRGAGKRAA